MHCAWRCLPLVQSPARYEGVPANRGIGVRPFLRWMMEGGLRPGKWATQRDGAWLADASSVTLTRTSFHQLRRRGGALACRQRVCASNATQLPNIFSNAFHNLRPPSSCATRLHTTQHDSALPRFPKHYTVVSWGTGQLRFLVYPLPPL